MRRKKIENNYKSDDKFLERQKYVLNKNNSDNIGRKNDLLINIYNPETYEIEQEIIFPFPIDSEIYLKNVSENGRFKAYRISRFKYNMFSVETFDISHVKNSKVTIGYEERDSNKNLFDKAYVPKEMQVPSSFLFHTARIENISYVGKILIENWNSGIISKEKFDYIFSRFYQLISGEINSDIKSLSI